MTRVANFTKDGDKFTYSMEHNNRELDVSFPKTNVVYGNAPFIGDIIVKDGKTEIGRITWYGIKHILDRNQDALEDEIKLRGISKWDLHDILTTIKEYEKNYKTRNLSIGMYNDIANVANSVYYLINKF
ncbi:MAG: hypothetical protein ABIF92_00205 [archaeon]